MRNPRSLYIGNLTRTGTSQCKVSVVKKAYSVEKQDDW